MMKNLVRSIRRHVRARPFFTALLVMLCLVIPGFLRIESIADTAGDAASAAKTLATERAAEAERDSAALEKEQLESCQTRNTFQANVRTKFGRFIDAIELAVVGGSPDPEQAEATRTFIDTLRDSVETKPENEDRDCNNDSKFDDADYLPT